MALRFVDSFDHYATALLSRKWTVVDGAPSISSTAGRRGTGGARFSIGNYGLLKVLDSQATWIVGMACKTAAWPSPSAIPMLRMYDGTSTQIGVWINPTGTLSVVRGTSTTLSTSSYVIPTGSFIYLEFKVTIHDSTGSYDVRVNGVSITSGSGVDTQSTANATANRIQLQAATSSAGSYDLTVDDVYICDGAGSANNDFLGDCRVDCYFPNGNGNSSQMIGSDGNSVDNYALVDETSMNSDTDYVESSTVSNQDTYAFGDISHSPTSIFGVQINLFSRKSDAGLRSIQAVTRSGGTDTDGTARPLATDYTDELEIRETDPNTSAAWTIAGFNSAEFGAKVAA